MIKLIEVRYRGNFQIALRFSDGREGIFDGRALLQRNGPLLDPLRDEAYFGRAFIDAGALAQRARAFSCTAACDLQSVDGGVVHVRRPTNDW